MENIRLGLCCIFKEAPIKFGTTTVTSLAKMERAKALDKLNALCRSNAESLMLALNFCKNNRIGCFRVNSQILPCKTHEGVGYQLADLSDCHKITDLFRDCGNFAAKNNIRLCFHPDQFVVLSSPNPKTVKNSLAEIEYQTEVAGLIGADVINIHGGGGYGDKKKALADFATNFYKLSLNARKLLTVENDDKVYTPSDLLPLCENLGIPLVYDVHHHRVLSDELTIAEATDRALATWDHREPLVHISSPINGWGEANEASHHDYISIRDFPGCWKDRTMTVEVEAKAKELAVAKLMGELADF